MHLLLYILLLLHEGSFPIIYINRLFPRENIHLLIWTLLFIVEINYTTFQEQIGLLIATHFGISFVLLSMHCKYFLLYFLCATVVALTYDWFRLFDSKSGLHVYYLLMQYLLTVLVSLNFKRLEKKYKKTVEDLMWDHV